MSLQAGYYAVFIDLNPETEFFQYTLNKSNPADSPIVIRTAFSNILDNAIKFTLEDGTVAVEMHSEQDFLKISVTNSFEPLSEEDLTGIFEPFYRTEQSPESGSGLGLAITRKIIEKHGGMIEALNADEGLKIQVRLPSKRKE